jgi:hypothetical protein
MAFFSWFKSKSKGDEPEGNPSSKPAVESETPAPAREIPPRSAIPRFRETVPQTARAVPGSSTFKRPVRATIDIPLQALWQSLPQGLAQDNPSLDPRRRIQIPRKEVRINDTDHTGTVSLYVLHAVCPEIFAAPIPASDNRSVRFQLPAWERLRTAEVVEVKTSPIPASEPEKEPEKQAEKPPTGPQLEEKHELPAQALKDRNQTSDADKLGEQHHSPSMINGETQPTGARPIGVDIDQTVRVALSAILRNLPPELNRTAVHNIAAPNTEIELPFDLIRSQLPNGRVTVPISIFLKALPETVRSAFGEVDQSAQVPIPLREIFRHLPSDALPLRSDQEMDEVRDPIDTPFSTTAREDAERFRNAARPVVESKADSAQLEFGDSAKTEKSEIPSDTVQPAALPVPPKPEPDFSALQSVFLSDERLDLPIIISNISALPGLQAALLHTADGRRLTGAMGDDQFERTALTLFPALFRGVKTQLDEQERTGLETVTLCWRQEQISVLSDGRLCLSVRHTRRPFKPGVREKLSLIFLRLTEALSSSEI